MNKKVFLVLFILLLTGCKAQYNLKINIGGSVTEKSNIYFDSSLLGRGGYSSDKNDFLEEISQKHGLNMLRKNSFFDEGSYFGYKTSEKYQSIFTYHKYSPAIKALYDDISITQNNNLVIIKSIGNSKISEYNNPNSDLSAYVENIEITISLPYHVVKHNADRYNELTNTYIWILNGNKDNTINLEYYDNELYTYNPAYLYEFVSPYVYIIIFLILVLLIVFLSVKSKARIVNKI